MPKPELAGVREDGTPLRARHSLVRNVAWATLLLAGLSFGCKQKWDTTQHRVQDEELDSAFFSGLNSEEIADVPEPRSLRPCCIFGNDVGVQVGTVTVPGYEVRNVLDINELGTHQYNKGTLALQPRGGERLVSDEASGILYTCRGGFIDLAHVRDNADRTLSTAPGRPLSLEPMTQPDAWRMTCPPEASRRSWIRRRERDARIKTKIGPTYAAASAGRPTPRHATRRHIGRKIRQSFRAPFGFKSPSSHHFFGRESFGSEGF